MVRALDLNADVPGTNPTCACTVSVQVGSYLSLCTTRKTPEYQDLVGFVFGTHEVNSIVCVVK